MKTCVFYIDESGNKGKCDSPIKSGQSPIFVLSGVVLPLESWRDIDRDYLNIKKSFFKHEILRSGIRPEYYEVKGNRLTSPRNAGDTRSREFYKALFKIVSRYGGKLFSYTTIKNPANPIDQTSLYTTSLQILVERFNCFVQESEIYSNGIMILDSSIRGFDFQVGASHMSFIFGHETGKQLNNISEAPLFADSKLTVGLQIIDNFSSLLYANNYHHHARNMPGALSYSHAK